MLGYGGGPSSIPLVHKEVVHKYKWLSDDDFGDILAMGNTLPGPIATKMAGYIGYRIAGVLGAIVATLSTVVPTVILMIVLLSALASFKDLPWVMGMTRGVRPVVGVMLAMLAYDFYNRASKGLGMRNVFLMALGSFLVLAVLNIHPGVLIGAILLFALLKPEHKQREDDTQERGASR
jgi:chromate transporter